jgi:hypothetical protein
MDIVCKNGRHFHDLQAAKGCAYHHPGGCGQCEVSYWMPEPLIPSSAIPPSLSKPQPEITEQNNNIRQSEDKTENQCPSSKHRTKLFPCPRCCYSESISERGDFFKTTTFWLCKYPSIVNWNMVNPEDIVESLDTAEE